MQMCKACQAHGNCLSKINLFKELGVDESKSIYLTADHKNYHKGECVFSFGDPIDKIIILRYGKIKTSTYDENGRESIRKIYVQGDIIGEDSIFLDKSYQVNGEAIENTVICQIDNDTLRNILVKDHDFSLKMIKSLSQRVYETEMMLEILSIKDSYLRLAAFLAYRARITKNYVIELSQENIASSLNITRETVSRKLSELEKEGFIENQSYKKIKIKNLSDLNKLTNL